jgi:hypothetical protein
MTMQIPDYLHYNGRSYALNEELLHDFFDENQDLKPRADVQSTALWRGYMAKFEIRNNELFIASFEIFTDLKLNKQQLKEQVFKEGDKLTHYSGMIRIDDFRGEFDKEPETGIFEYLQIRNGDLIKHWQLNHTQLQKMKELQFEYFKLTDNYNKINKRFMKYNAGKQPGDFDDLMQKNVLTYQGDLYVTAAELAKEL